MSRRGLIAAGIAFGLAAAVNAAPRFGHFSGDAVIHLTIAERAAQGAWFEFNPGEVASGSTSLAWTGLEAALFALGDIHLAARVIPTVCAVSLLAAAGCVFALAVRVGASRGAGLLAALGFLAVPGTTYNAMLGMENPTFAAVALSCILLAHHLVDSEISARIRILVTVGLAACGALAVLLRPEGALVLAAIGLGVFATRRAWRGRASAAVFAALLLAGLLVIPAVAATYAHTGHALPGSSLARMMAARRMSSSFHVAGPIWLYGAAPLRIAYYFPAAALAIIGVARHASDRAAGLARTCLIAIGCGVATYTLVTGCAHTARYLIWVFALLFSLAAAGLDPLLTSAAGRRWLCALGAAFIVLVSYETISRFRASSMVRGGYSAPEVIAEAVGRKPATDRLLAAACAGGCCSEGQTPYVAITEVQLRHRLDARVAVMSLDGRTAPVARSRPLGFDARGCPDFEHVLQDPNVVAVLENPRGQLAACEGSLTANAMNAAWGKGRSLPGWRWAPELDGFVRDCAAGASQPSVNR